MSEAGSPIAEAERGAVDLIRRLDGTILGVHRLGNLSVPFRLSARCRGWLNPEWVPIRTAVASKIFPQRAFSRRSARNLRMV
jgi:hypothetical protein